jgi:hypothetical protein
MKPLLDFDDAGASDDHPAKGVLVGHIREWYDEMERLKEALRIAKGDMMQAARAIELELRAAQTSGQR